MLDLEAKEVSSLHSGMGLRALEIDILPVCRILFAHIGMAFVFSIDVSKHVTLNDIYLVKTFLSELELSLCYCGPTDNCPHRHIFVHFDGLQSDLPHRQEVAWTSKLILPK